MTLKLNGTNSEAAPAYAGDDADTGLQCGTDELKLVTGGTARATVDSSGRLLAGTTSARTNVYSSALNITPQNQFESNFTNYQGGLSLINNSASGHSSVLTFGQSYTNTLGGNGLTPNNEPLGIINFTANDGSNFRTAATIQAFADGTTGSGDVPGRLAFYTTADGSATPTERMRLTSTGMLACGTTSNFDSFNVTLAVKGAYPNTPIEVQQDGTNSHFAITFRNSNGLVGSITTQDSATAFNTSSDYRLKENVVDLDGAIDRVKQLSPKRFNFIASPNTTVDGFLAHEAQTVVPEAVTGTHNEVDDDGNAVMQGIDQSKLVPLLTAALQEAIAKIETLETKVAALEAAS